MIVSKYKSTANPPHQQPFLVSNERYDKISFYSVAMKRCHQFCSQAYMLSLHNLIIFVSLSDTHMYDCHNVMAYPPNHTLTQHPIKVKKLIFSIKRLRCLTLWSSCFYVLFLSHSFDHPNPLS